MLFNIFLALLVVLPMGYFFMSGNKAENKLKSLFLASVTQKGVQVGEVEVWQKGVLGLDSKNNFLYYQGFGSGDNELKSIDLSEVKSCTLEKTFSNEKVHDAATKVLLKAFLNIKGQTGTTAIKMYDADDTIQMQDDVLKAIKWEKTINAIVLNHK